MKWTTKITKVEPNRLITRGYRQEELIGNVSFADAVYLVLQGELPDEPSSRMMDALLTACIDHGVGPPSTVAARTVASGGVPLPTAVAAGIMAIGESHAGAIEKAARILQSGVEEMEEKKLTPDEMAERIVAEYKARKDRLPGYGHRVHTSDPRTERLFSLASEQGIAGKHVLLAQAIGSALANSLQRELPINVDGAIAAIVSDMGFDWRLGKAFFLIGRSAGLSAHVYEELTEQTPMRRMAEIDCEYAGPPEKDLPPRASHGAEDSSEGG
jgi:citryl-CoA lyase